MVNRAFYGPGNFVVIFFLMETITFTGGLFQADVQQGPIVALLVSEVIPEPEVEGEAPAKSDLGLKTEASPAVFTLEQFETIESRATEAEHMLYPVDDKTDVADGKTSNIIKIDEETAAVAAVATDISIASAAVVITNELPTAQPSLIEAMMTKDHSADIPAIEAVSTQVNATKTVVLSPEPTVECDDLPHSTCYGGPSLHVA